MNKLQITCHVVVIAVAALIIAGRYGIVHKRDRLNYVGGISYQVGTDLIAQTNSPWLARLDPAFHQELSLFLTSRAAIASMLFGDEPPPTGNGKAHSRLILTNTAGQTLTIRLRADSKSNRFFILSHRTVQAMATTAP